MINNQNSNKFDLNKTQALAHLFVVPAHQRDEQWLSV